MRLVYPHEWSVRITRVRGRRNVVRFTYSEVVSRCPPNIATRLVGNTRVMLGAMLPNGVRSRWFRRGGRTVVEIRGTLPLRDVADMVISEFIALSGVGAMPFGRMWKALVQAAVTEAVQK